jgi:hypothetical protein
MYDRQVMARKLTYTYFVLREIGFTDDRISSAMFATGGVDVNHALDWASRWQVMILIG